MAQYMQYYNRFTSSETNLQQTHYYKELGLNQLMFKAAVKTNKNIV